MKYINFNLLLMAALAILPALQSSAAEKTDSALPRVVPAPNAVTTAEGHLDIGRSMRVDAPKEFAKSAEIACAQFAKTFPNFSAKISAENPNVKIAKNASLPDEAYELEITPQGAVISASSPTGALYGFQTLRQALQISPEGSFKVEACKISDKPAFAWRGCMIDPARSFLGKQFVLDTIDRLLELKMNVLHIHLTDHQGWRIEIKKYPKLTGVGAWYHETARGGFLTQDDAREIVKYAAERGITVVPEIEVLSHATAAAKSYPFIGDGYGINVYDPKVCEFFKDILREIMEIFPSKVIHLAGDEVVYSVWKKNPEIKKYMEKNGLKTMLDVHLHYMNEMGDFLRENGRRMIAWDEAFGKGDIEVKRSMKAETAAASKDTIMHFWTGNLPAMIEAANSGYSIVNANRTNTYLNYSDSPSFRFRKIPMPKNRQMDDTDDKYYVYTTRSILTLAKAYNFNPIPDGIKPEARGNILGASCQVWAKPIASAAFFEYMAFPRMAAFAEVAWTAPENKDYKSFMQRLKSLQLIWDYIGVNHNYEAAYETSEFYPPLKEAKSKSK